MKKSFDCVEMKRKAQEIIAKRLEGLSDEEKLLYWQKRDRELREKLKMIRKETVAD